MHNTLVSQGQSGKQKDCPPGKQRLIFVRQKHDIFQKSQISCIIEKCYVNCLCYVGQSWSYGLCEQFGVITFVYPFGRSENLGKGVWHSTGYCYCYCPILLPRGITKAYWSRVGRLINIAMISPSDPNWPGVRVLKSTSPGRKAHAGTNSRQ